MNAKLSNMAWKVAPVALAVLGLGTAATAGPYPGSLTTFTNGAGNTASLFTISGNTITATGDTSGTNTYYINGQQLVGFRSIYLVKTDGTATSGVTTITNGGYVSDGTTVTYYNGAPSLGGYTGYDDNGPGKGFPDGSHFFVAADPTLAGKSASNKDTFGSFTFNAPIAGYDIGVDYILAGNSDNSGPTGRAYFAVPTGPMTSTPEPGSLAALAVGGLGLAGLMLRARKRTARVA